MTQLSGETGRSPGVAVQSTPFLWFYTLCLAGGIVALVGFFAVPASTRGEGGSVKEMIDSYHDILSAFSDDSPARFQALRLTYLWWLIPALGGISLLLAGASGAGALKAPGPTALALLGVSGGLMLAANFAGFIGILIASDHWSNRTFWLPVTGYWEEMPAFPTMTIAAALVFSGYLAGRRAAQR